MVHRVQTFEGVTSVKETTLIKRFQIVIDITPGQGRTAQHDRNLDTALVHQFEVVFHDEGGLNQQTAHADGISAVLLVSAEDVVDRLFDTEVHDLVAVVGQDNVHEVLADVVHIAFYGGQHHRAFGGRASFLFHERLEETHGGFHGFGRLQNKWQLHLTAAKKIAHDLHPLEQNVVDNVER